MLLPILSCNFNSTQDCSKTSIESEKIDKHKIENHCKLKLPPIDLSSDEKSKIYQYESTKEIMSLNSFKSSFEEIYTEDQNLWNPTDNLQQGDPTNLILGVVKEKNSIGIKYAVGGIRCCDTIFQVYTFKDHQIVNDKQYKYN